MENPFRRLTEEEKQARCDWEDAKRRGYVQVASGPGRPPTPVSLRNREPHIVPPVDAILTLYLHCVVACPHEVEALKAVSAWLDAQPEIADIDLSVAG